MILEHMWKACRAMNGLASIQNQALTNNRVHGVFYSREHCEMKFLY